MSCSWAHGLALNHIEHFQKTVRRMLLAFNHNPWDSSSTTPNKNCQAHGIYVNCIEHVQNAINPFGQTKMILEMSGTGHRSHCTRQDFIKLIT
jgi:hypothetical protein